MSDKTEAELAAAARRFMDSCPEGAEVETFDNPQYVGLVIKWSLPGVGFGEITIAKDRASQEWTVDDECMGGDSVARILALALPSGATTALDFQNLGSRATVDQLIRALDDIDATGTHAGRFGSEAMNAIVDRYKAAKGGA